VGRLLIFVVIPILLLESLAHIASVLPRQDILSFACCSKKIRDIAQSPSTWRLIYYDHPGWRIRKPTRPPALLYNCYYEDTGELDEETHHFVFDWQDMVREREVLERRWRIRRGSDSMEPIFISVSRLAIYCVFVLEDIIITGGKDHAVSFWHWDQNLRYLDNLLRYPKAHDGSVLCMVVDTQWRHKTGLMITGGSDAMIKVWDLDNTLFDWDHKTTKPKPIRVLVGHTAGVLDLALCERRFYSW